jgi:multiple sugar transport system substrate-binding protein/putative spermidine/putrescine transport system substrate-binding protein
MFILSFSRLTSWYKFACVGALLIAAAMGTALAQVPLKNATFDVAQLTRDNFYQVLEPVAKREGKLVLYNYAGNFDPVWKVGLIPRFEARYGIKVVYQNVSLAQANQQLIAVHRAGTPSPVDVYSAGNTDNYELLRAGGVITKLDLAKVMPNLMAVPDAYKRVIFGVDTGGTWPIVHVNQTALGYDSALLPAAQVPTNFDALLTWAEKNPGKFALTAPGKGGSGSGFLYAAALHWVSDAACRKVLQDPSISAEQTEQWASNAACLAPVWANLKRLLKVADLTNGNADTLNLINNKQVLLGTVWEDQSLTFVNSKLLPPSYRLALLDKGMVSGGDGLIVPANAKSPAAALLFIDMALSQDFQIWKLEHHASRSPRSDIDPMQTVSADAKRYLVPLEQMRTRSIAANWRITNGLVRVFEDRVLATR